MKELRALRWFALFLVVLSVCSDVPSAQRLSKKHYEDSHNGYRFKAPDDWVVVPPQADARERGLTVQMDGDNRIMTVDGRTFRWKPDLKVMRLVYPKLPEELEAAPGSEGTTDEEGDEKSEERKELEAMYKAALSRLGIQYILAATVGGARGLDIENPDTDEDLKARNKLVGRHRSWIADGNFFKYLIDVYEFELEDAKVVMVYTVAEKDAKKWKRIFKSSAMSFEAIERERTLEYEEGGTYEDILAYHEELTTRTPGWRVIPTPSERFLIKTSSDNSKFINEVIERLEMSRDLYEEDFPPPNPITDVSVVRICSTAEEFHSYGGTSGGTAGWFSPRTAELVLFDFRATDRNATYAVMSHEAFHQYCHYLFDQSEAHRWFDEGHGDYYGGAKFTRGRAKITPKMPGGLNRLSVIKGMVQRDEQVPLKRHLNFDHGQWQNQGPTGVSCYAQSWSVIYMLRRGSLGDVSRKLWKKEYAEIIPNYVTTLQRGFREAYAAILKERESEAKFDGRELTEDELNITSDDLGSGVKEQIWADAMKASWGQIDLDEFEENWLNFVRKGL